MTTPTTSPLPAEPIAIVGVAGRFPGAPDLPALWQLLSDGGDAVGPVPSERWDTSVPLDPDKQVPAFGGFLTDVDAFDAALFGISPREAADIDPQQRLVLEQAWRSLEDAALPPSRVRGTRTGVYVGTSWHDYELLRAHRHLGASQHSAVGNALDVIASRVSYVFGLTGPSLTVETGCSSALVALHLAVGALRAGDAEAAIVAGVNLVLTPDVSIGLTHFGGLSPHGRCAAFSAEADGFVRGEGVAALYLKPLSAARRDGDRVRAVIVATTVNNDGGGESLVTPNPLGQVDLLRRAYRDNGIDVDRLAYVEAHGTGTGRGDPIEATAIGQVLAAGRDAALGPLPIGSVKTNIGHLEPAAGIAGLVKGMLALEHGVVPASLHSTTLNPAIAFDELNVRVVREPMPLPAGPDVLIGVNSFGWGGTNAHVVLGRAPLPTPAGDTGTCTGTQLGTGTGTVCTDPGFLPVAAHSTSAQARRLTHVADALEQGAPVAAVAAELAALAPDLPLRTAVTTDRDDLVPVLRTVADDPSASIPGVLTGRARPVGTVAFVFPGQGSQWRMMGAGLYGADPVFTRAVDACHEALRPHVDWDLVEIVSGRSGPEWLRRVDQVQPVLWAVSLGLAEMWAAAGVRPDVVVGHSQGEIAAAAFAGLLSLEDSAMIIVRRSVMLRRAAGKGRMMAVDLSPAQVGEAIEGFEDLVSLAVDNGSSCVLSGDVDAMEALKEILEAEGAYCRMVNVDYASHSPQMDAFREELHAALADVRPRPGRTRMLSTVTLADVGPADLTGPYWAENLRHPVLFGPAMTALFAEGVSHVVEISPHPVLSHALTALAGEQPEAPVVIGSLYRDTDTRQELALSRAKAFVSGLSPLGATPRVPRRLLPPYPMDAATHWLPQGRPGRAGATPGLVVDLQVSPLQEGTHTATLDLDVRDLTWLRDHRVDEAVVVPGALFLSAAISAARSRFGQVPARLSRIGLHRDLTLGEAPVGLSVVLREDVPQGASVEISSLIPGDDHWRTHATLTAWSTADAQRPPAFPADLVAELVVSADTLDADGEVLDTAAFYARCAARGLNYGPDFQGVRQARLLPGDGPRRCLARLEVSSRVRAQTLPDQVHPALLDAALQVTLPLLEGDGLVVPTAVENVMLTEDLVRPVHAGWALAEATPTGRFDVHLFAPQGTYLMSVLGLELTPIQHAAARPHERELRLTFPATPRPDDGADPATAFLVTGAGQVGDLTPDRVAQALRAAGATVLAGDCRSPDVGTVVHLFPDAAAGLAAQRAALVAVTQLVRAASTAPAPPRVVLVTAAAQQPTPDERPDPGAALAWGLGRVLRREHPELRCELIDVPAAPEPTAVPAGWDAAAEVAAELVCGADEDQLLLRPSGRYAGRLQQGERTPGTASTRPWRVTTRDFRLEPSPEEFFDGLRFRALDPLEAEPGTVVVEVRAAALNFIDVMKAAGTYPDTSVGADLLGGECAGVVVQVGPGVTDRHLGQRVVACGSGAIGSHLLARAEHTAVIPENLTDEDATALPLVFATAWYGLVRRAQVQAGETVLVHSGTGGLGLAAIAVARSRGAHVIATAGSARRRGYLRDLGITHVFDSRSLAWAGEVREVTGGRGVDVVLNSLTGAAIDLGLDVLGEDGRFVEVGKKDIFGHRALGMSAFAKGISFSAVDLAGLMNRRPQRFAEVLAEVWAEVEAGRLAPLPVTRYPFAQAANALRQMSHGNHIGKFVLTDPSSVTQVVPRPLRDGRFSPHGCYLITGGHGALGLSLAEHLAAYGAGAVALVSRSGGSPAAADRTADWSQRFPATRVLHLAADVTDRAALADALDRARDGGLPLRGVFHAAGLLDDATLLTVTPQQIERVLAPKVDGARLLDELTGDDPLDAFVLFSSVAALVGNAGQAAYAAGNAYLDALATARRQRGVPGLAVQWGPFTGVGLAAAQDNRGARLADRGMGGFGVQEAWQALDGFLADREPEQVVAYVPLNVRQWFDAYPDTAAQPSWERLRGAASAPGGAGGGGNLRTVLADVTGPARLQLVSDTVRELAGRVLRLTTDGVDPQAPFKSLGLDSLMSLEMRNRLEGAFGFKLSPTLLWTYGTCEALSAELCRRIEAEPRAGAGAQNEADHEAHHEADRGPALQPARN